ncbi:MAG TPA: GNAT family N-acetyltransferase [Hyphomicrobiaceae bacterium]|jgi:ribosomal protein S18 acetylase RimI-like enzyme|nr:GNAT family N-acetyltransferase [Hyphomicrobiaceae bacterium]
MPTLTPTTIRAATPNDAAALADFVHFASEGLALRVWSKLAGPGGDPWAIGRERARRETGSFSYRNAYVLETDGAAAAGLIGYPLPDAPLAIAPDLPATFVPLQELENLAAGSWYVNVLAAYPEHRGKGLGRALLDLAQTTALELGRPGLSIIVSDGNRGARRLYERCGYREAGRRAMLKEDWINPGTHWVLLTRDAK